MTDDEWPCDHEPYNDVVMKVRVRFDGPTPPIEAAEWCELCGALRSPGGKWRLPQGWRPQGEPEDHPDPDHRLN